MQRIHAARLDGAAQRAAPRRRRRVGRRGVGGRLIEIERDGTHLVRVGVRVGLGLGLGLGSGSGLGLGLEVPHGAAAVADVKASTGVGRGGQYLA